MVVEQKFKVLQKAEKEVYQNMNSNLREIEKNSAEFREFAENSHACLVTHGAGMQLLWLLPCMGAHVVV